jgi:hypothetical protein
MTASLSQHSAGIHHNILCHLTFGFLSLTVFILCVSKCLFQIAQRSLPFLHNCIKEMEILDIAAPPGAVACWVFLCCLEVLHTCERFNDSGQVEAYSLYTASLWAYARDKVRLTDVSFLCMHKYGCELSPVYLPHCIKYNSVTATFSVCKI